MGEYKNKAYPLRLDNDLMAKVRILAEKEDRPLSRQLEKIIREFITDYESKYGEINIEE